MRKLKQKSDTEGLVQLGCTVTVGGDHTTKADFVFRSVGLVSVGKAEVTFGVTIKGAASDYVVSSGLWTKWVHYSVWRFSVGRAEPVLNPFPNVSGHVV